MSKKAIYICLEGLEGCFKTTNVNRLYDYLITKGFKVLLTKEPGTVNLPLTMELRKIMLDNQYDDQLTITSRELISSAIRSIHMEKLIIPSLSEYDYIIQDRGILSGLAYGEACGNDVDFLKQLNVKSSGQKNFYSLYNHVIYLYGNVETNLDRAITSKQEFKTGDAMESRGISFMKDVENNMNKHLNKFNTSCICIDNKDRDQVFNEIKAILKI